MTSSRVKFLIVVAAVLIGAVIFLLSTTGEDQESRRAEDKKVFLGAWSAQWRTPSESFSGIDAFTSFEMDGTFIFTQDSVTVVAMGFPGCVFGVDTLSHTQVWTLSEQRDTLNLISEGGIAGIQYKVNGLSDQFIELQLLDDIFISLEKASN